jgi:hypothetical protein
VEKTGSTVKQIRFSWRMIPIARRNLQFARLESDSTKNLELLRQPPVPVKGGHHLVIRRYHPRRDSATGLANGRSATFVRGIIQL